MYYTDLNYDSYDEYLKGPEWEEIHDIFYQKGGEYRCRICWGKKGLILHKRSYFHLTPEFFRVADKKWLRMVLVWLCEKHNNQIHFYKKDEKVPLDYLFLWERERGVYKRPLNIIRRVLRSYVAFGKYTNKLYGVGKGKRKIAGSF